MPPVRPGSVDNAQLLYLLVTVVKMIINAILFVGVLTVILRSLMNVGGCIMDAISTSTKKWLWVSAYLGRFVVSILGLGLVSIILLFLSAVNPTYAQQTGQYKVEGAPQTPARTGEYSYEGAPQGEAGVTKPQPITGEGTRSISGQGITQGLSDKSPLPTPLDTDGDGYYDYEEDFYRTNPKNAGRYPDVSRDTAHANNKARELYELSVKDGSGAGKYYQSGPGGAVQSVGAPGKFPGATAQATQPVQQAKAKSTGAGGAVAVGVLAAAAVAGLAAMAASGSVGGSGGGSNCGPAPAGFGNDWWYNQYAPWCRCMGGVPIVSTTSCVR